MKLLFLIVTITFSQIISAQSLEDEEDGSTQEWSPIDILTLNTDSELRDILSSGIQDVISQEGLSEGNAYLEEVLSIENQPVGGSMFYRFNVVLSYDGGKESQIRFVVNYFPSTESGEVQETEFITDQGEPPLANWQTRNVSDYETDPHLKEVFTYGFNDIVTKGIASEQLSPSSYYPSEIYSIKEQNLGGGTSLSGGMSYRFNLKLEDYAGSYATVIFVVDELFGGEKNVSSYYFTDVAMVIRGEDDGDDWDNDPFDEWEDDDEEEEVSIH